MRQIFRDASGKEVESAALRLSLSDFICRDCEASLPGSEDTIIVITSAELCEIVEDNMDAHRANVDRRARRDGVDGAATIALHEEQEAATQSLVTQVATPPAEYTPPQDPRRTGRRKMWRLGFSGNYKGM